MNTLDLSRASWRKSRRSAHDGGNCVELASVDGLIVVRDSKAPTEPALIFESSAWATFVDRLMRL